MPSSRDISPADAWLGRTLRDRYRLVAQIGGGGKGFVYRAWDLKNDRYAVVKMPLQQRFREPQFLTRWEQELATVQSFSHMSVVPIIDVGIEQDTPYAVMPYLAGGSLKQRIRVQADGRAVSDDPSMLWLWLPAIAHALDDIHRKGFVHRDVKPDNILFDGPGQPYLSDFWIAKVMLQGEDDAISRGSNNTGFVLGTADYMAPELASGVRPNGRVDQYALAVVIYEVISGGKPFHGPTPAAVMIAHATKQAQPLAAVRANIPVAIGDAVGRGMSKDPAERFDRCVDFAAAVLKGVPKPTATTAIRLMCPACGRLLSVKHDWAGKKGACPRCESAIAISSDTRSLWIPGDREAAPASQHGQASRSPESVSENIALNVGPERRSSTGQYRKARKKSARLSWALQGLMLLALAAGGFGLFSILKDDRRPPGQPTQIAAADTRERPVTDPAASQRATDERSSELPPGREPALPLDPEDAASADDLPFEMPADDRRRRKPSVSLDAFGGSLDDSPRFAGEEDFETNQDARPGKSVASDNRQDRSIPTAEAIAEDVDLIKQAFAEEYKKWAESGDAADLIDMLRDSATSTSNPVRRYALLVEAERAALNSHALKVAIDVAHERSKLYGIDRAEAEQAAINVLASQRNLSARGVYQDALSLANERLEQESMAVAANAAALAVMVARAIDREQRTAATKARREQRDQAAFDSEFPQNEDGGQMILRAVDLQKTIRARQRLLNDYEKANDVLASSPDDEGAHGTVAQYLCFVKGDWENGLPHLAAGSLGLLSELAQRESDLRDAEEPDTAALFALAGEWWNAAETANTSLGGVAAVKHHSAILYEQALPRLDDPIEQTLAAKRIREIFEQDDIDEPNQF